jgi:hypothetical protein
LRTGNQQFETDIAEKQAAGKVEKRLASKPWETQEINLWLVNQQDILHQLLLLNQPHLVFLSSLSLHFFPKSNHLPGYRMMMVLGTLRAVKGTNMLAFLVDVFFSPVSVGHKMFIEKYDRQKDTTLHGVS